VGFPVARFLDAFGTKQQESRVVSSAVEDITTLLGSFTNPRPPARAGDLSLDLSRLKKQEPETADARRTARQHVLDALAQPLREGGGPKEQKVLEAVRHFFVEHGNGAEAIVHFHRLVYSARGGGKNAIDTQQAYGNNYNPQFVQQLESTFTVRGSTRSHDGLSTAQSTARGEPTLSKEEARDKLLQVAGTPRGKHLSTSTPRNEQVAEQALRDFLLAHGEGDEGMQALQDLIHGAAQPTSSEDVSNHGKRSAEVRRIVAGEDADDEVRRPAVTYF